MESVPSNETPEPPGGSSVRVLSRAFAVLRAFTLEQPRRGLGELAGELGLPKATVHRLVGSLVAEGLMARTPDGRYELGIGLISLGEVARRHLTLVDACAPALAAIARLTDETVMLAQVDWPAGEVILIDRIDSPHPLSMFSAVGHRSPLYPGCLGRAALAAAPEPVRESVLGRCTWSAHTSRTVTDAAHVRRALDESRELGYAIDDGEFLEGTAGVAVPVGLVEDRPRGSIGIVGPASRLTPETLHALGARLREETASLRRPSSAMAAA